MLDTLYPILIVIGSTIGAVLAYLWLQARNAGNNSLALIRLNEQLQFDTPAFLRGAWPLLSRSGLQGISWRLDWFGVPVEGQDGQMIGNAIHKEIHVAEMKLAITFRQNRKGERRFFDETLIETFLLLLRTDMWIKAGATDATFSQMSRLTLFLQHDMKNVAQFIQLMADQLAHLPAGKEQQVLDYLRTAAPLIRHRADRIVDTLTAGQAPGEIWRNVDVHQELQQICDLYRLQHVITGSAQVRAPENSVQSALDNILKNYSDISSREKNITPLVTIDISEQEQAIQIIIEAKNVPPTSNVERLFEPFWSNDPAGLGIGLYQAKQMLETCGGTITVQQQENAALQFQIRLPKNSAPA